MRKFWTVAIAVLMAAALPARAEGPLDVELARAGVGPSDAGAVVRTAERLNAHGVSHDPVVKKVREGIAKRVHAQAIAGAAARLADRMLAAAPLYPGRADAAQKTIAVEAAAKTMIAGGRIESVKSIFDKASSSGLGRQEWHRPFDACAALIITGAGDGPSTSIITMALDRGYTAADISALPVRFGRLLSTGKTPQQSAAALLDAVGREMDRGGGPGHGRGGPAMREGRGDDGKGPDDDNSLIRGSGKAKVKKPPTTTGGVSGTGGRGTGLRRRASVRRKRVHRTCCRPLAGDCPAAGGQLSLR